MGYGSGRLDPNAIGEYLLATEARWECDWRIPIGFFVACHPRKREARGR